MTQTTSSKVTDDMSAENENQKVNVKTSYTYLGDQDKHIPIYLNPERNKDNHKEPVLQRQVILQLQPIHISWDFLQRFGFSYNQPQTQNLLPHHSVWST